MSLTCSTLRMYYLYGTFVWHFHQSYKECTNVLQFIYLKWFINKKKREKLYSLVIKVFLTYFFQNLLKKKQSIFETNSRNIMNQNSIELIFKIRKLFFPLKNG